MEGKSIGVQRRVTASSGAQPSEINKSPKREVWGILLSGLPSAAACDVKFRRCGFSGWVLFSGASALSTDADDS